MSKPEVLYSFEQSNKASLEYFNGDSLAANVFVTKYALKDSYDNYYGSLSCRHNLPLSLTNGDLLDSSKNERFREGTREAPKGF